MKQFEREAIAANFGRILKIIEKVPDYKDLRPGIQETPMRFAKAVEHWTSGYNVSPADIIKLFEDGADGCDEMVIVRDIPFYSQCEHHFAPFFGTITIAYIPNKKILGLSKFSRIAEIFCRRLQVQERITNQIAEAFMDEAIGSLGVGVVVKARHMCCESRGIAKQGSFTITSALRGVMKEQPETRAEFMSLVNSLPPSL
ncbi:MAG: GTP cyclohydrolase I FolE [Desulfocapsa sp.]|nr:GTP cyclohydrolase I FolE [Desulfocapsa sp.]